MGKHSGWASTYGIGVYTTNGKLYVQVKSNEHVEGGSHHSNRTINDGKIHIIHITFGALISIYIDGVFDGSLTYNFSFQTDPIRLGKSTDSWWGLFEGEVYYARVYNRNLNLQEIQQNYSVGVEVGLLEERVIARIKSNGEMEIAGELTEDMNSEILFSLNTNGDLTIKELIEGETFSLTRNGIKITNFVENVSFE